MVKKILACLIILLSISSVLYAAEKGVKGRSGDLFKALEGEEKARTPDKEEIPPKKDELKTDRKSDTKPDEKPSVLPQVRYLSESQLKQVKELEGVSRKGIENIGVWEDIHSPRVIQFDLAGDEVKGSNRIENGLKLIAKYGTLLKVSDTKTLRPVASPEMRGDCSILRFQHVIDDVPVWGSGLSLIVRNDGSTSGIAGRYIHDANVKSIKPSISVEKARSLAFKSLNPKQAGELKGGLTILSHHNLSGPDKKDILAWHFIIEDKRSGMRNNLFVDATNGNVTIIPELIRDGQRGETVSCTPHVDGIPRYHISEQTGVPDYYSFVHFGGLDLNFGKNDVLPQEVVYKFLEEYPAIFLTGDPRKQLKISKVKRDMFGNFHITTEQKYADMPVFGSGLNFDVSPDKKLLSVTGNFVPQLYLPAEPSVQKPEAFKSLYKQIALSNCKENCNDPVNINNIVNAMENQVTTNNTEVVSELGIFPGKIVKGYRGEKPLENRLSWKIAVNGWLGYVDALNGNVLYSYRTIESETPRVYNAGGSAEVPYMKNSYMTGQAQEANYNNDTEAKAVRDSLNGAFRYFVDGQRNGLFPIVYEGSPPWDPNGGSLPAIINLGDIATDLFSQGTTCAGRTSNAHSVPGFGPVPSYLGFCPNLGNGSDVVTHELFHAVTRETANLTYADESGALNESYSDVFGELVYLNAATPWIHGEVWASAAVNLPGARRNMRNPGAAGFSNQPGTMDGDCYRGSACLTNFANNNNNNDDAGGVHINSGIPNRAAVLLSDRVGMDKVAALYFYALNFYLRNWSGFSDQMIGVFNSCQTWINSDVSSHTFNDELTNRDCSAVLSAFQQVGIAPNIESGWWNHPAGLLGSDGDDTWFRGTRLYNGCSVQDVRIRVQTPTGENAADSGNGYRYNYHGDFGVSLDPQDWHQGGEDLEMKIHWWQNSFRSVTYLPLPVLALGPGLTDSGQCYTPIGTEIIPPLVSEWNEHLYNPFHADDVDVVRPSGWDATRMLPPRCTVIKAVLQKETDDGRIETLRTEDGDASGAYIRDSYTSYTSGTDLTLGVRWWTSFDLTPLVGGPRNIKYRAAYTISQPFGVDCTVNYR
ncbi:MAG: M4 family metallopeptidase [Nitrospirae bacterium]|nr:M4 family metallopeptidase [Nitrospirota bacterium]